MDLFKRIINPFNRKKFRLFFISVSTLIIVFFGFNIIKDIDLSMVLKEFSNLTFTKVFISLIFAILAILTTSLYDFILKDHFQLNMDNKVLLALSFLSNSLNNILGFSNSKGLDIRNLVFDKYYIDWEGSFSYNLLLTLSKIIGLSILSIFVIINFNLINLTGSWWLFIFPIIFLIYGYFYTNIGKAPGRIFNHPNLEVFSNLGTLRIKMIITSTLDWSMNFLVFILLSRFLNIDIHFITLFISFVLGSCAGILSLLPGGIGAFDFIVLSFLSKFSLGKETILSLLVSYRLFYNLLPLLISSLALLLSNNTGLKSLLGFKRLKKFIYTTAPLSNIVLSIFTLFAGLSFLIDGLFPYIPDNLNIFSNIFTSSTLSISHHLAIAIGLFLVLFSKQIRKKVKRSYYISFALIFLGIIISLIKGFSIIQIVYLVLTLILLIISKNSFYRESCPSNLFQSLLQLGLLFLVVLLYLNASNTIYTNFNKFNSLKGISLKHFKFQNPLKSSLFIYFILIVGVFLYEISKKNLTDDERFSSFDKDRLLNFFENNNGNILSHLVFLEDKSLFWDQDDKVLIQYGIGRNKIIVLGDLMGDEDCLREGLNNFLEFIDLYGYKSAFYQVNEDNLSFYHEAGYYLFKLGETGMVDLNNFSMEGSQARDFRNTIKRFDKDGYEFELIKKGDLSDEIYSNIRDISQEWLDDRKEMSFSLGSFSRSYLDTSDLALVKNRENNKIIAFANIIPSYDGSSLSLDLMRLYKDSPNNTMNFLIINILLYYKNQNYEFFNLGMAPLSNVGTSKKSHVQEKFGHIIFEYGNYFYSFQGLRRFKNKFHPQWEGRYLIYEDFTSLPNTLLEITLLIHNK